ncbi:MAG: UV-damage endonuclease [Bogoriella megaspora]|nr:MAG: UV-damage endonuclease [Bogoriella megaspora]
MGPKRKRSSAVTTAAAADNPPLTSVHIPLPGEAPPKIPRRSSKRQSTNPTERPDILDAPNALRASPDNAVNEKIVPNEVKRDDDSDSPLSDVPELSKPELKNGRKSKAAPKAEKEEDNATIPSERAKPKSRKENTTTQDPEAETEEEADEEEIKEALSRPPPVNSDYLPLPWKGRLGFACLNTYLRSSNPPVFSSRTCRIASILEHRHPLRDPSQPEHATKNRPDKDQPADIGRGMQYVENIGLANAHDIVKMIRWNDKYGIKFMRLSSEMFPFASHEEYGYKLAPFAAGTLAEAGKVIAEFGHRVTTHPGQFTQLGSPRKQVIDNAIRDLEYHDEMLSLLKLPPQIDRDAVMILHMGGVFGSKSETLDRFRANYARLSPSIKNRLVLENDDVSWSAHDLLPVCEELNIPFVLDYHHHNIIFDPEQIREGTKDIMSLYPRIFETWQRKNITPKMHYSEPTPSAITGRQRRKHNPRVAALPPCPPTMDLMIEAKDKEQAVFELMRTYKLPGFDLFNDIIPHVRKDDNKPTRTPAKKKNTPKKPKGVEGEDAVKVEEEDSGPVVVPDDEVGMGGFERRVYWPPGMEDWLRPVKRVVKKKDPQEASKTPVKRKLGAVGDGQMPNGVKNEDGAGAPELKKSRGTPKSKARGKANGKKTAKAVPTPSTSDNEEPEGLPVVETDADEEPVATPMAKSRGGRKSARAVRVSYAENAISE